MRKILILIFTLIIITAGCNENSSDAPADINISVRYYHPDSQTSEGVEYYSQSVSLSWGTGSTTIPSRDEYFNINVPAGAKLSAVYSKYYKSFKDKLLDKKEDYEKTNVASKGLKWDL
jgi:hypothetical protein